MTPAPKTTIAAVAVGAALTAAVLNSPSPQVTQPPAAYMQASMSFQVQPALSTNDYVLLQSSTNLKTWQTVGKFTMNPARWTNGGKVTVTNTLPGPAGLYRLGLQLQ